MLYSQSQQICALHLLCRPPCRLRHHQKDENAPQLALTLAGKGAVVANLRVRPVALPQYLTILPLLFIALGGEEVKNCSFFVHEADTSPAYNRIKLHDVGRVARSAGTTLWQTLFYFFKQKTLPRLNYSCRQGFFAMPY